MGALLSIGCFTQQITFKMTVHGIRTAAAQTTKVKNGVGAFILQCKKMEFHYCDWAGSSRGMNGFIKGILPKFAAANPQIEFSISPGPTNIPSSPDTTSTAAQNLSACGTCRPTRSSR